MKKIVCILFVAVVLVSCGNREKQMYMYRVDSLSRVVDTINVGLKQIKQDSALINAIELSKKHSKEISPFLDTLFEIDEYRKKITEYMMMYKFFKKINNHWGELNSNVEYTNNQLKALKHDIPILWNKGDTAKIDKYVKDETNAVKIITEKYVDLKKRVDLNMKKFPMVDKEITQLLDSLKQ